MRAYYFGCWRVPGHHFWLPGSDGHPYRPDRDELIAMAGGYPHTTQADPPGGPAIPWGYRVDGGLLRSHVQGRATVHHLGGWTALTFPDYSVDDRPGSHSTYVFDEVLDFDAALAAAREHFSAIFERYDFDVVPAE